MRLEIYKYKIDWYCSIINLQEIICALTHCHHWNNDILLTKRGKMHIKTLNLYLNKFDEDSIYIENDSCTISISEDSLYLLESYVNNIIENINSCSGELNDLFFYKTKKWISLYIYILSG